MVSTNPPSPFVIDVYRLGYYGGKGGPASAAAGILRRRASSLIRTSAKSGSANAAGSRPSNSRFRRTGPAASTSAS